MCHRHCRSAGCGCEGKGRKRADGVPCYSPALCATATRFVTYALASWLGIGIQYGLTLWLSGHMYYLLANLIAIVVASISNFVANDRWTFRRRPPP